MKTQAYRHFRIATTFSLFLALVLAVFLSIYGKNASFLMINQFNGPGFDYFFPYWTYLGDGLLCLPFLLLVFFLKREFLLPVITAFLICALLTTLSKGLVFADAPRPLSVLKEQVRTLPGIKVHTFGSFPSGHTSMAFTYALLMAFLVRKKFCAFLFPILGLLVGYSRVYLGQHFVTDVLAGLLVGMTSVLLALLMYEKLMQQRKLKAEKELSMPAA